MDNNDPRELVYTDILPKIDAARTKAEYQAVILVLETLGDYRDAPQLLSECKEHMEKDEKYQKAAELLGRNTFGSLTEAIFLLKEIPDWRDANTRLEKARNLIQSLSDDFPEPESYARLNAIKKAEERSRFLRRIPVYFFTAVAVLIYVILLQAS